MCRTIPGAGLFVSVLNVAYKVESGGSVGEIYNRGSAGNVAEKIIVALDVDSAREACELVRELSPPLNYFKVGSRLFVACGPSIIREIKELGARVFLDLKFHDIPNTVAEAAEVVTRYGVNMFNIHLSGGREMIKAAVNRVSATTEKLGLPRPLVLGVTVLSSMNEEMLQQEGAVSRPLDEHVVELTRMGLECGLDGVIASPREALLLRERCGRDFTIVTPGVRPTWAAQDDQQRILTPKEALRAGASYLVIGRPIIRHPAPAQAVEQIIAEIDNT